MFHTYFTLLGYFSDMYKIFERAAVRTAESGAVLPGLRSKGVGIFTGTFVSSHVRRFRTSEL